MELHARGRCEHEAVCEGLKGDGEEGQGGGDAGGEGGGRDEEGGMLGLSSTYLKVQYETLPKGGEGIWAPKNNCLKDIWKARFARISKGLRFS